MQGIVPQSRFQGVMLWLPKMFIAIPVILAEIVGQHNVHSGGLLLLSENGKVLSEKGMTPVQ